MRIRLGKSNTVCGDSIDVRRVEIVGPVTTSIQRTLVVRVEDHDIRLGDRFSGKESRRKKDTAMNTEAQQR